MFQRSIKLLSSCLLLVFLPLKAEAFRLIDVANPTKQQVTLNVDPRQEEYAGHVTIELLIVEQTKRIQFNSEEHTITNAYLIGNKQKHNLEIRQLDNNIVEGLSENTILKGSYKLKIEFTAAFNKQSVGLYKTVDQGNSYLFTQFEMSDARRAFPVFDEPGYKIPFQLTISAPEQFKVFANTPEVDAQINDGWVKHVFDTTPPLSSYLVALAVGDFDVVEIPNMSIPARVITPKGKGHLAASAQKQIPLVLKAMENYFGRPYPYKKMDSVALPEFPFGAMENAGLITYREDILLVDENSASQSKIANHVMVIAHEIAHQWYGNLVTMEWWNDLWLNEAFASWMANKITHQIYPEFEKNLYLPQNRAMVTDARATTKAIRKPIRGEADIMDGLGLAYSKGSAVLSMVEQWLGEDGFKRGVREYINRYAFKNAKASDLWGTLGKENNKDVASVLSSFTNQSSFPKVHIVKKGKTLDISQSRFRPFGVDVQEQQWTVPVNIKYGVGEKVYTKRIILNEAQQTMSVESEFDWIYPDLNAKGYYRWSLDSHSLRELATKAKLKLTVRERLSLVNNLYALFSAGDMSGGEYLQMVGQFLDDPHPKVIAEALTLIQKIKEPFITDGNMNKWKSFVRSIALPALEKIGFSRQPDEATNVAALRTNLIKVLGIDGQFEPVIETAKKQSLIYLKDPTKVDSSLARNYLTIAAYHGEEPLLKTLIEKFEKVTLPSMRTNLLIAINAFKNKRAQSLALDYMLSSKVTASDLRSALYTNAFGEQIRRERLLNWIEKNYGELSNKLPPFILPSLPGYVLPVCDQIRFDKVASFFERKTKQVPAFERTLEKKRGQLSQCLSLRDRELESANLFLSRYESS